ncbi:39S ribosomal protein L51, mitochondrial [Spea bombifrons]|uniref:39S ribosomal protein L51, mitochondrial n=1 Tax=Spea bombifrons TaxID=233779 RepID=UPI00234B570A|nr:39S ribosomal protein L51, mitochondrial [Spea bombifrons]
MWVLTRLLRGGRSLCSDLLQSTRPFSLGHRDLGRKNFLPQPKDTDRWDNKRALFGVYDNIGILGEFRAHPRDLIVGPTWLKGFRGNELQRCIRKRQVVGSRMFFQDREDLKKRISFLYRRFNRYGKHR